MASRKHDSGTSKKASKKAPEKARISFLLNHDDDGAVRTQLPRPSHAVPPAQQRSSSKIAKSVKKKRQKNAICQTCGRGFYSNPQLHNHVSAVHLLLRPFECSICHKKFSEKGNAAQQDVHENVRNFHCPHPGCGQSFKRKTHLKQHEEVHSREGDGRCKSSSS